ncbi:MAG: stage III sporulation protein AG [Bacillota bacterium]|nr:stage III sporulation protein AG [Bacillota bacterium]
MSEPVGFWGRLESWLRSQGGEKTGPPRWALLALGALGVCLLLLGGGFPRPGQSMAPPALPPSEAGVGGQRLDSAGEELPGVEYERAYEERLNRLLSLVEGAGRVWVEGYLETGPLYEYAEKVRQSERTTQEQSEGSQGRVTSEKTRETEVVTVRDDGLRQERPVVVVRKEPRIRGVVVVAEGARRPAVRARLIQAVQAALALPPHRIQVLEGSWSKGGDGR